MTHPERIVPDDTEPGIVALHRKRYEFAEPWCLGKEVLDVACGVGYGTAQLGEVATRAVGIDLSPEAIAYAQARYGGARVEFDVMDATMLAFASGAFDVVCAFEALEHFEQPELALAEATRVLRADGILLASTPRAASTTYEPANPWHHVEWSRDDLERVLKQHFESVELYGQRRLQTRRHRLLQRVDVFGLRRRLTFLRPAARVLGTAPMATVTTAGIVISRDRLDEASELVAVCRSPIR